MKTYTKYIRKQYRCAIVKLTFWDYLVLALHYQDVIPKLCDNVSTLKHKKKTKTTKHFQVSGKFQWNSETKTSGRIKCPLYCFLKLQDK